MTLFNDSEVYQKERPDKLTEGQSKDLYERLAKEIIANGWSSDEVEDIAKDLQQMEWRFGRYNGFELGKDFDSGYNMGCSYEVDTYFCEWLDSLDYEYREAVEKNVKDWVKAHSITAKLSKGDEAVSSKDIMGTTPIKKGDKIYITGIKTETATYTIWNDKEHNGGYVFPFEVIENNIP